MSTRRILLLITRSQYTSRGYPGYPEIQEREEQRVMFGGPVIEHLSLLARSENIQVTAALGPNCLVIARGALNTIPMDSFTVFMRGL